jgi:predicted ferric reductase
MQTTISPRLPAKGQAASTDDTLIEFLPPLIGAILGVVIMLGVGVMLTGQAGGLMALGAALLGQHSAWYLSRASAFAAYVLLWWSMILGLSITSKAARAWPGGPAAAGLHEHASLLGLGFGVLHALVLLGDQYIGYSLTQILVPFAGSYMPFWVGLGQVGLYLMALVTVTFYLRKQIGARAWRAIHFLSFLVFALSLGHGLFSGSDSSTAWAFWMYVGTGASVVFMTLYRILARKLVAAPRLREGQA